jgi:hypothetical protein
MDNNERTDIAGQLAWWVILFNATAILKELTPVNTKEFWLITLCFIGLSLVSFMRGTLRDKNLKFKKDEQEREEQTR